MAQKAELGPGSIVLGEFGCPLERGRTFNECAQAMKELTGYLEADPYHLYAIWFTSRLDTYGSDIPGDWLGFLGLVHDYEISPGIIAVVRNTWGNEWIRWPGPTPEILEPPIIVPDLPTPFPIEE